MNTVNVISEWINREYALDKACEDYSMKKVVTYTFLIKLTEKQQEQEVIHNQRENKLREGEYHKSTLYMVFSKFYTCSFKLNSDNPWK